MVPVASLQVEAPPSAVDTLLPRLFTRVPSAVTAWLVANNWLPLTASVLVAEMRPAATLCTWRSAPALPTLTTPAALPPAKL